MMRPAAASVGEAGLRRLSVAASGAAAAQPQRLPPLRRSVLYMPASNDRALAKVGTLKADAFILDLEDAVAPAMKVTAREKAVRAAATYRAQAGFRKELVIRVNGKSTQWHEEDLVAACTSRAHAILLPKVESAREVQDVAEKAHKLGAPPELGIWCMVETPRGVQNAYEIATASNQVSCLVMGTVDLANDLHCLPGAPGRWNLQVALQTVVLAARAAGRSALDGVYIDIKDTQGLEFECRQGRELGFEGKTLIHPDTLAVANSVFAPTTPELEHCRRVLQAHADSVAQGSGVVTLDGKLVEALHVQNALRVMALAEQITTADRG
jgi:citrate lyase subunit beta/citryl-CoA lyase